MNLKIAKGLCKKLFSQLVNENLNLSLSCLMLFKEEEDLLFKIPQEILNETGVLNLPIGIIYMIDRTKRKSEWTIKWIKKYLKESKKSNFNMSIFITNSIRDWKKEKTK